MLVLSAAPLHSYQGNVLQFQQHKSQWTLNEQQKWASHWLSAHRKDPKPVITKRHDKYTRSRKKNLRKKSRNTVKQYVQELQASIVYYDDEFGEMTCKRRYFGRSSGVYFGTKYLGSRNKEFDPRFSEDIICNKNSKHFQFTHSLSELTSIPSDFCLNRTVHLLFSKHNIPFVGRLTCISHCGFIHLEDLRILGLTANHRLCHHSTGDLIDRWNDPESKWFHYKCIGRVMVYEEETRQFRDITSLMMDVMKYKMVQWLTMNGKDEMYSLRGHQYTDLSYIHYGAYWFGPYRALYGACDEGGRQNVDSEMSKVMRRFNGEQDALNFHVMLLRKHHPEQMEKMRFAQWQLGEIICGFVQIGGTLIENANDSRCHKNAVVEVANGECYTYAFWDGFWDDDGNESKTDSASHSDTSFDDECQGNVSKDDEDGKEQQCEPDGDDNEQQEPKKEKEEKRGFMLWDDRDILKMSKKMSKRTRTC